MSRLSPSAYVDRLARRLGTQPERATRVRLRTLLARFGYRRRRREAVAFIKAALQTRGLVAEFSVRRPSRLDERVAVRLVVPGRLAQPKDAISPARSARGLGRECAPEPGPAAPAPGVEPDGPKRRTIAGPLAATCSTDLSTCAERAIATTVEIRCGGSGGSGVIVHPTGLVLTSWHVVADGGTTARRVRVRLATGRPVGGTVCWSHSVLDMALLWLDRPGPFAFLALGDPRALRPAEPVVAVGHPAAFRNTVSCGRVCNPSARVDGIDLVQTDVALSRGNSGGPLVNARGEVVAVNSWFSQDLEAGKFAVRSTTSPTTSRASRLWAAPAHWLGATAPAAAKSSWGADRGSASSAASTCCIGIVGIGERSRWRMEMGSRTPQNATRKTPVGARTEAARRRALKAHAHARIDAYLQSVGIRDPAEFTDEQGSRHIGDGDVEVIAFVDVIDDLVTFGAGAMLMPLPSDGALLAPLMRTLLDQNPSIVGTPRFGIANGQVVLSLLQPVEAMADDEFGEKVSELMTIGKHLAKELRKKFGGTVKARKVTRGHGPRARRPS